MTMPADSINALRFIYTLAYFTIYRRYFVFAYFCFARHFTRHRRSLKLSPRAAFSKLPPAL